MRSKCSALLMTAAAAVPASAIPPVPPPPPPQPPSNADVRLGEIASGVDPAQMRRTVEKLVSFGTRHTLSSQTDKKRGIGAALDWTESEFKKFGLPTVRPCDDCAARPVFSAIQSIRFTKTENCSQIF